ncbi:MAG: peptide chain release factor N(5)-glutamine methyltransferase [Proteobacteria bacterium]|nr:peptide chain release factor N(5)-glutamine methyltransferase [Pseudomonadota bacterium]
MRTIQDYLKSGAIDIAPLLSLVLEKSSAELISNHDYLLSSDEKSQLEDLILKRQKGMPFAYLSGNRGFYHLDFKVTPDTLIPRPETELLIDIALDLFIDKNQDYRLLDLGTGSGIIAATLADKNPHWQVTATDFSQAALDIAQQNATTEINFQQGSWFEAVANQDFDLIISNPPYIAQGDVYLDDLAYEPISALIAGEDGLDDIRIIISQAPDYLKRNGFLLLEHGHDQQARIVELLQEKFNNIQTFKDYNNIDRAILARKK